MNDVIASGLLNCIPLNTFFFLSLTYFFLSLPTLCLPPSPPSLFLSASSSLPTTLQPL